MYRQYSGANLHKSSLLRKLGESALLSFAFLGLSLFSSDSAIAGKKRPSSAQTARCTSLLRSAGDVGSLEAYGIDPRQVQKSPGGDPVVILGEDETHFSPPLPGTQKAIRDIKKRNVVVVGVGVAGSVASVYASDDPENSVLALDTQKDPGGLAHGITLLDPITGKPVMIDNGAAYWAAPDKEEFKIFQHIGMPAYKRFAIPESIDTYLLYGKLYPGIWETETVKELPKDFALFKFVLRRLDRQHITPKQPINKDADPYGLDKISVAEFIARMPEYVAKWISENPRDTAAKHAYNLFMESQGKKPNPMANVAALMDNYCRSAHGGTTDEVDAHEFLNFYVSELTTRYTGPLGTGEISSRAIKKLQGRENVEIKTSAQVVKISNEGKLKKITYLRDGQLFEVLADKVIFAAPMKMAPKIIEGYAEERPKAVKALDRIENSDYLVVNVIVDGQIDRKKLPGYDVWLGPPRDRSKAPTDVVNGTWTLSESQRPKNMDVLTIYMPLGKAHVGQGFTDEDVLRLTEEAKKDLFARLGKFIVDKNGRKLQAKFAIASRWPLSIPLNAPGHAEIVDILSESYDGIYFSGLGLDTPSVEASLFYGKKSALDALGKSSGPKKKKTGTR